MSDLQTIKDRIVGTMLPEIATSGWSWPAVTEAAAAAGFQDTMPRAVFPEGLNDVVAHFSDMIDRAMLKNLETIDPETLRVRERVETALLQRFKVLEGEYMAKAAKAALAYWAVPVRVMQGQRVLWRSSDRIWNWAGDQAQDYNRYTKRGLLSSILMGTTLVWLDDKSEDHEVTKLFLKRRIENVMEIGKAIGTIRPVMPDIAKSFARTPWTSRK